MFFHFLSALCPIFKFLSIRHHSSILVIVYGCDIYMNNLTRLMNGNNCTGPGNLYIDDDKIF